MAVHLLIKYKIYSIYSARKKYIVKSGAETSLKFIRLLRVNPNLGSRAVFI